VRMSRLLSASLVASLIAGGPGTAAAAEDDDEVSVVAVFPVVTKGTLAEAMVETVSAILAAGPQSERTVRVLTGTALSSMLRQNPLKAVSACERNTAFEACFARLADDIGADRMIIGRMRTDEAGVVVLLLSIASDGKVDSRVSQTVASTDELTRILDGVAVAALFGVPYQPAPEPELLAPPEPPPVLPVIANPGEPEPAAEGEPEPVAEGEPAAEGEPSTAALEPVEEPPAPPVEVPNVVDERAVAAAARVEPAVCAEPAPTPWVRYAGIASAGAGIVALVAATVLAFQVDSLRGGVQPGTGMSQREAAERYRNANDLAPAANALFVIGSVAVLTGGGLLTYDVLHGRAAVDVYRAPTP